MVSAVCRRLLPVSLCEAADPKRVCCHGDRGAGSDA